MALITNARGEPVSLPGSIRSRHSLVLTERLLYFLKYEWMIADLAELHDGVHQRSRATLSLRERGMTQQSNSSIEDDTTPHINSLKMK